MAKKKNGAILIILVVITFLLVFKQKTPQQAIVGSGQGIILLQLDDAAPWWNIDMSNNIVTILQNNQISLTVEVAPFELN
jgi:hypothetical protein